MTEAIKSGVMDLLKNYITNHRKMAVLRYELEHPSNVTPDEVIDAMAFAHSGDGVPPTGHISNKTLYIALNYQEKVDAANRETASTIAAQLWELEREYDRLSFYMSLLPERDASVIRLLFMEGKSNEEAAEALHVAARTLRELRNRAIEDLCKLYEYRAGLQ